jgi:hypothetical protein
MVLLHDRLHREFITRRDELLTVLCGGESVWPAANGEFVAYKPQLSPSRRSWKDWAADFLIYGAVFGLAGAFFYFLATV